MDDPDDRALRLALIVAVLIVLALASIALFEAITTPAGHCRAGLARGRD